MPVVNSRSSSSSPERGGAFTDESEPDVRRANNPAGLPASSSFFIIHESSSSVILPNGGGRSPPKLRRGGGGDGDAPPRANRSRQRGPLSTGLRRKKSRSKMPSSAPESQSTSSLDTSSPALRNSSTALSPTVHEGHEGEEEDDTIQTQTATVESTANTKRTIELSILNRCGSAPDLPMHSPLSASVYSSSKKRTLQSSSGASPHLATLQRSRLTPLPANTRAKVVKPDPLLTVDEVTPSDGFDSASLFPKDPLLQEKMRQDAQTIASLKQRLVLLEREVSASSKYRHLTEKQIAQLSLETQRLQGEKTQQQARIDELDKTVLRQRHEYDKLAARYAAVYANLQKLVDQQQNPSDNSAQQSALQALAKENQDFLRKLRVLEARHAEDKTLTSNQEKKIKRLKAEIEALQHMHDAKNREDDVDESSSDTDQVSRLARPKKRADSDISHGGRPNSASSTASIASSTPRRAGAPVRVQVVQNGALGTASHLVTAEAYQYIDPNILKVLEKVDSQFSITNAINLSVVLKKWLNSCVHIVCSTHLPTVLQTLLKRMCELLHCEHVALFTVDYAARKLVSTSSERGPERWELPLDKGISGYAARHNVLCNVPCANDDPRFFSSTDSITGTTSREVLALPIVHELQLYLEAHLGGAGDSNRTKVNGHGVFAVLRAWNTTHQKPFSPNDQILGSLLAIQAGIILRQTAVTKTLQKINHKTHQILQMPSEIIAKASVGLHTMRSPHSEVPGSPSATGSPSSLPSEYPGPSLTPSVVQLVAVAQKELGECLGIKQLRIFVFDAAADKLWHAGEQLPHDTGDGSTQTLVRRYVSAQASLCALLLRSDATSMILTEPSAQAAFNDTVDIPGGARGLYLVPILAPWGNGALPFGVVQVARVAKARLSASPFALTASEGAGTSIIAGSVAEVVVNSECEAAQQTEDRLMLELLALFCRVFAGLLHHIAAEQLYDACPPEILQAQLATLSDHLDDLAARRTAGDDSDDDTDTPHATTPSSHRASSSHRSGRHASIAAVRDSPPPSRSARRAASADSKHRSAPLDPQRVSSPPTNSAHQSRVGSGDQIQRQSTPAGAVGYEAVSAASAGAVDKTSAAEFDSIGTIDNVSIASDDIKADTELDPESEAHELLEPDQVQHEAEETAVGTNKVPASLAEDNIVYATTPHEESVANETDIGYNLGDNDAYDPTLWPAADNIGAYEEGAAWEYGVVEDAALANDDEDANSTTVVRGGSHISTNSTYAIDLHLSSRNTSSAETD